MKKEWQIKADEPLEEWIERVAKYWNFGDELREVLNTIKSLSYIIGVNDGVKKMKNGNKNKS